MVDHCNIKKFAIRVGIGHKVYFLITKNIRLRDPHSIPDKSQAVGFFSWLSKLKTISNDIVFNLLSLYCTPPEPTFAKTLTDFARSACVVA